MSAAKYALMYMQGIEQDQLDSSIIMLLYYRNALPRSGNSGLPVSLYVYLVSTNLVDSHSKASSSQAVWHTALSFPSRSPSLRLWSVITSLQEVRWLLPIHAWTYMVRRQLNSLSSLQVATEHAQYLRCTGMLGSFWALTFHAST